jgi:hypothetical protein
LRVIVPSNLPESRTITTENKGEEKLGRTMLFSVEREEIRLFGPKDLDFVWFGHFDLGLTISAVSRRLKTFDVSKQHTKEAVRRAPWSHRRVVLGPRSWVHHDHVLNNFDFRCQGPMKSFCHFLLM